MPHAELAHLELLAEVDALLTELRRWADRAPDWPAARACQALVRRLVARTDTLRVRLEAPLVVATLGGTGTGKSSLVNALVGDDVSQAGRERPTTRQPTLICRPDLAPASLGIPADRVHLVTRDAPVLRDVVLLDCPDPDTTEDEQAAGSNLARLRELLPYCDVLLITSTQQKYRSARVLEELADAAPGARLVFVQTHADIDADIRDDWRGVLQPHYRVGEMFLIDSVAALADARAGVEPHGDFARLLDLLTRELAGAAAARIRRANFIELAEETLVACRARIDADLPAIAEVEAALNEQRARLATRLALTMRDELLDSRRPWESRLLGEVASRWGFSPFALVLRVYQGLGSLLSGALLMRVRSPAQLALWGAMEGSRALSRQRQRRRAETTATRALGRSWDAGDLRTAAIIIDGYAAEAGLPHHLADSQTLVDEAAAVEANFLANASTQLQTLVSRLAERHSGTLVRLRYELLLAVLLVVVLYRMGRNFFWESWLAPQPAPVLGVDFFLAALFWTVLWSTLLLWSFTARLRRGLRAEIDQLALRWNSAESTAGLFSALDEQCRAALGYRRDLDRLGGSVAHVKNRMSQPLARLGHKVISPST